ncbi:MAG: FMN-binding protein [Candidatus Omnitrophica bacterium]|nr:FMN-binding protein [Candidatus Omnitrophota bacterium]
MVNIIQITVIQIMILSVCFPGYADQLINVDQALKSIFKNAQRIDRSIITLTDAEMAKVETSADITFEGVHNRELIRYDVFHAGSKVGVAMEDTVMGKWGPIHYLVGLDLTGKILKVVVLDYQEIRGKPIARNRYMKQYKGKTIHDPIRLRRDIDGVSGATISSRSITDGIRKIVHTIAIQP